MKTQTVTVISTFPATEMAAILERAQAGGVELHLGKDHGAYFYCQVGTDTTVVHARGHQGPPPSTGYTADDPWIRARVATAQAWGDDDFLIPVDNDEVHAALVGGDVRVKTTLETFPMYDFEPTNAWGRRDPHTQLVYLEILPA